VLTRLHDTFRTFRRTKAWQDHVSGGVCFCEATINPETRRWHPHYHIICQGTWWDKHELSAAWLAATGDSHIVDIQAVRDFDEVCSYVVKYTSKGMDPTVWRSQPALSEAIDAFEHHKMCFTFGTFRKLRLLSAPKSEASWIPVKRASDLIRDALAGDKDAYALCKRIWGRRFGRWLSETYSCVDTS